MLRSIFILLAGLTGWIWSGGPVAALTEEQQARLVAAVADGTARQAVGDLLAETQPDAGQLPRQVCDAVEVMGAVARDPQERAEMTLAAGEAAVAYMETAGFPEAARSPLMITIQEQCVLPGAAEDPEFADRLLQTARDRVTAGVAPEAGDTAVALFAALNAPAPPGLEEGWAQIRALAQATGFATVAQNLLVAVEPAAGPAAPAGGGLAPPPAAPGPVGGGGGGGRGLVASPS